MIAPLLLIACIAPPPVDVAVAPSSSDSATPSLAAGGGDCDTGMSFEELFDCQDARFAFLELEYSLGVSEVIATNIDTREQLVSRPPDPAITAVFFFVDPGDWTIGATSADGASCWNSPVTSIATSDDFIWYQLPGFSGNTAWVDGAFECDPAPGYP